MLVKEICTPGAASCARDVSVLEAARLMRRHHTGSLIVVDDPNGDRVPVGILTDRDIVMEVLATDLDPASTTVAKVMSSKLVIASASEDVLDAVERMRVHGVRRMPVVDHDGSLFGVITLDDILTLHATQTANLAAIVSKEQNVERRARR
jgi:CBS domain-containing protein